MTRAKHKLRRSITAKIKALSQKTVARGCTPGEAKAAAEKLAELKVKAADWRKAKKAAAPYRHRLDDLDRLRAQYEAAREWIEDGIPSEILHAEWRREEEDRKAQQAARARERRKRRAAEARKR